MLISNILISWYHQYKRDLPWRNTTDPYFIWLSEIILQQTRVEQGRPYYEHFISKYPDVGTLANASSDEIMRSWQGLGYYSRARNLHFAAKQVLAEYNGSFPRNYKELIKLKGVGEYTAAAIASFAFKEATPVLDGNVFRFLARHFGLYTPINSPKAKKEFISIALELIDTKNPDLFNQAIMEFGALQCKPQSPNCEACPLNSSCWAFLNNKVNELPLKDKKLTRRSRFCNYFILKNDGSIALNKREEKDIWQELYEFPLIETKKEMSEIEVLELAMESKLLSENMQVLKISEKIKHVLSHQDIFARFFEISDPHFQHQNRDKYLYIKDDEINFFAFPRLIEVYLRK
jgi:A/G-specific adenine glycosylase